MRDGNRMSTHLLLISRIQLFLRRFQILKLPLSLSGLYKLSRLHLLPSELSAVSDGNVAIFTCKVFF